MEQTRRKVLVVDDSDIDRIMLKSILYREYEVLEAQNGKMACELISKQNEQLSAIMLDISMPDMDGFGVLEFMAKNHYDQITVFLVTAEPTVDNVQRAAHYKIAGFIGKPFHQEDLLQRLWAQLAASMVPDPKPSELKEIRTYIEEMEELYNNWLVICDQSDARSRIVSGLMNILLIGYNNKQTKRRLSNTGIELVSKAAYFCDIGEMLIPSQWIELTKGEDESQEALLSHPYLGSKLIQMNRSRECEYFTSLCSDICLYHHERFDGQGYPSGLKGKDIPIYSQICRLADEFELLWSEANDTDEQTVPLVIERLAEQEGMVDPLLYKLLKECENQIINYFNQLYQE